MKELIIEAKTQNLAAVLAFIDEHLEELDCSMKAMMQIDLAMEEIFVNVCQYAYENSDDKKENVAIIRVEDGADPRHVRVSIADNGIPFDPLAKKDPDITLSSRDRQIGGLGIFMVKKSMDDVKYEYKNGQNILTFRKDL